MRVFHDQLQYLNVCVDQFHDVNGDGLDELVVGSPLRSEDITEEFYGGRPD